MALPLRGQVVDQVDLAQQAEQAVALCDQHDLGVVEDAAQQLDPGVRRDRGVVAVDEVGERLVEATLAAGEEVEEVELADDAAVALMLFSLRIAIASRTELSLLAVITRPGLRLRMWAT